MKNDDIMMALLSTLCPPVGLLGGMIKAVSSSEPDAGMGFLLDLATTGLPSLGFTGNLAFELAKAGFADHLTGRQIHDATTKVTPYSVIPAVCGRCRKKVNYYSYKGNEVLCNHCIAEELSLMIAPRDDVFVISKNIDVYHRKINERNHNYERYQLRKLSEQGVTVSPSKDKRIPEFYFSYANQNNMRWAMAMWSALAQHWPSETYLTLLDFSNIPSGTLQNATAALTVPEFKESITVYGRGESHAYVAMVHYDFKQEPMFDEPSENVSMAGFGTKTQAQNWLWKFI